MNGISCQSCAFWVPPKERGFTSYGFAGDQRPDLGQCRRMPPQNFLTDKGLRAFWPLTLASHWCGEHAVQDKVV